MLPNAVVERIKRLLAGGETQRAVARVTGVSRGSVQAIAQGKRRVCDTAPPDDKLPPPPFHGPAVKCPGCGGMAQQPCRVCRLRRQRPLDPLDDDPDDPSATKLELRDGARRRYEAIRAARQAALARGERPRGGEVSIERVPTADVGRSPTIGEVLDAFEETA